MIPTDTQIRAWIADLRRSADYWDRIEADAIETARRARSGDTTVDGHKASHGIGGPGGGATWLVETETGEREAISVTTVEALAMREPADDPFGRTAALAFDLLAQAAASVRGYRNTQEKATGMVWARPSSPVGRCCEPGCDDPIDKAGRCSPCYMRKRRYEQAHPGDICPPIGADELDARRRRRQQTA